MAVNLVRSCAECTDLHEISEHFQDLLYHVKLYFIKIGSCCSFIEPDYADFLEGQNAICSFRYVCPLCTSLALPPLRPDV